MSADPCQVHMNLANFKKTTNHYISTFMYTCNRLVPQKQKQEAPPLWITSLQRHCSQQQCICSIRYLTLPSCNWIRYHIATANLNISQVSWSRILVKAVPLDMHRIGHTTDVRAQLNCIIRK